MFLFDNPAALPGAHDDALAPSRPVMHFHSVSRDVDIVQLAEFEQQSDDVDRSQQPYVVGREDTFHVTLETVAGFGRGPGQQMQLKANVQAITV